MKKAGQTPLASRWVPRTASKVSMFDVVERGMPAFPACDGMVRLAVTLQANPPERASPPSGRGTLASGIVGINRQGEMETTATPRGGGDPNLAIVGLDNSLTHR